MTGEACARRALGRRGAALARLAGGRGAAGQRAAVPLSAVAAAPEWLCLPPQAAAALFRAVGAAAIAGGLGRCLDGRALSALAEAVGATVADWALERNGPPLTDPLAPGWSGLPQEVEALGRRLLARHLALAPATAPLATLVGEPAAAGDGAAIEQMLADALAMLAHQPGGQG